MLLAEQSELDEILDVEHADGLLAVDDDDAVERLALEHLHGVVEQRVGLDRDRRRREADVRELLVEDRAAARLELPAQVAVGEDAGERALAIDERDDAEPR